jgi:acetyl-CoA carboxylase beta subunit
METLIFIILVIAVIPLIIPKRLSKKEAMAVGYSGEGENCRVCGAFNYEEEIDINGGVCYNCHTAFYK